MDLHQSSSTRQIEDNYRELLLLLSTPFTLDQKNLIDTFVYKTHLVIPRTSKLFSQQSLFSTP